MARFSGALIKSGVFLAWICAPFGLPGCLSAPAPSPRAAMVDPPMMSRSLEKALKSGAASRGEWPADKWWESFGDPQLSLLVERALAGSPDMAEARARVQVAENIARAAGAAASSNLSAGAGAGLQRMSENSLIPAQFLKNPYSNADVSLNLGYNLDLWGAARMAVEGRVSAHKAALAEAEAVRLAVAGAVCGSYFNLQNMKELSRITESAISARRESAQMIRRKMERGLETELNLLRAQFAVMGEEDAQAMLDEAQELERNRLAALLGAGPDDGADMAVSDFPDKSAPAPLPEELPLDLVHRRADIAAARWRVESAGKGIGSAKAAFYPNINLRALAGLQTVDIGKLFNGGSFVYNAAGALHLPLFDGGALKANLGMAEAEYDLAVDKYNQAVLRAARDAASALAQTASLERRIEIAQRALAAGREVYRLTMARFEKGLDDYLTALKAQDEVFAQERKLAQLQGAARSARAALIAALGGGFTDMDSRKMEANK